MVSTDIERETARTSRPARDGQPAKVQSDSHLDDTQNGDEFDDGSQSVMAKALSIMRTYVLPAAVALVCGAVVAWGYGRFFESKASGHDRSSAKTSPSRNSADSSDSEAAESKVQVAEAERKSAMEALRHAQTATNAARQSEGEIREILDFLNENLLAAGRSDEAPHSGAYSKMTTNKDVTLREALDKTEARVGRTFADRPRAEASIREMLGSAYLNLQDTAKAITQYERAFALREAAQGVNDLETGACRNQLAVIYRLAGRLADAERLFESDANSPAHASAKATKWP